MTSQSHFEPSRADVLDQKMMRIIFAGLLVIVAMVGMHRLSGADETGASKPVLASAQFYLSGDQRSGATLRDADQDIVAQFQPGEGGLIETMGTVIQRQRKRHQVDDVQPIIARLHGPRQLSLFDPATGQSYNMSSYGDDNVDQLLRYLHELQ